MIDKEIREEKERLIKHDLYSISNRVRHAFNQGYELGRKSVEKVGKWIAEEDEEMEIVGYHCSRCDLPGMVSKYCANCGARMEVDNGSNKTSR